MQCRRLRAVVCLLLLVAVVTPARAERLPIKIYTTADGLGSSNILAIVPDSRGFLWFATRNGLSRFDGSEFRAYTTDDGLPHPVVNHFLETRDGEYWVATNGGGICRFNVAARPAPGSAGSSNADVTREVTEPLFTCHKVGNDFSSNRVNVVREDRQRRLWLGTDDGLFRMERSGGAWRVERVALEPLSAGMAGISAIHEDSEGRLWIGLSRGLLRLDPDRRTCLYTVKGHDVHSVGPMVEHDGTLWVGLSFGLLALRPERRLAGSQVVERKVLNPGRACFGPDGPGLSLPLAEGEACLSDARDGLPDNRVSALARAPSGRLWIGTRGGLAHLDGTHLTSLATTEKLTAGTVWVLAHDQDGHLWIGTDAGVVKLTPDGLVSYGLDDGLGHPGIHTIFEAPGGGLFAVSGEWVVNRFDGRRFHAMRPRVPEGATYTYHSHGAFLDRTGRWWLLTDRGLWRLRPGTTVEAAARQPPEAVYSTRNGLPGDSIVRMFEDSRGDIWIASRSGTSAVNLSRWERATGRIGVSREGFGAAHQAPLAFAEDRRGAIWVGFERGGLARYHENRFTIWGVADGVPPSVMGLHADGSGRLWIASASAGLSMVEDVAADRPRFVRYTTAQGLSTNNVRCVTEDRWGRIYLGTSRGLDRLDPATGRVKRLTTSDGLAGDYVTTAFRDRTGALWFGTTNGLSRLVPTPDPPSVPPPVWIGELRIAGTLHPTPELGAPQVSGLRLEPSQNHLQVAFFGVGFGAGGRLRYRYRLDGAEPDWTGPTDRRVVHYASLAPGRYRFVVEAVNGDGVVSSRPASVSFTVLPPVWRRWWFQGLTALSVAVILYSVYRYRVARLLALERVRTRIAADLHDDIGGTLSRIAIQSEVARRDVAVPTGASARRLAEIGDTARSLVDALGDVVWSVDPRQDELASVERRVREYAADVLGACGVRWTFHGTGDVDRIALDPQARRDLLLLLKEGVTNVARHAGARTASLHLRLAGRELRAELRDDGCGFDPEALEVPGAAHGHGLTNMRRRAKQLGGRLEVESQPGVGTRLLLTVPLPPRRRMNMRLTRIRR